MLALASGPLDEADALVEHVRALGDRVQPEIALPVYRLQWHTLCDFRGSLADVEPAIADLCATRPARPVFRCALAQVQARLGRTQEAARTLAELGRDDFSGVPFDQEWLLGMSLLAEASALLGDAASARLYEVLHPWSALNVVDQCEAIRGSVSRYLGLLAVTMQRLDEAERHFEAALTMNRRMGFRPWLAYTETDYARMLLTRDRPGDRERAGELLGTALATYRRLGMESHARSAEQLAAGT